LQFRSICSTQRCGAGYHSPICCTSLFPSSVCRSPRLPPTVPHLDCWPVGGVGFASHPSRSMPLAHSAIIRLQVLEPLWAGVPMTLQATCTPPSCQCGRRSPPITTFSLGCQYPKCHWLLKGICTPVRPVPACNPVLGTSTYPLRRRRSPQVATEPLDERHPRGAQTRCRCRTTSWGGTRGTQPPVTKKD
jgi:hypothetical protein